MKSEWKRVSIGDVCDTVSETYRGTDMKVILINTSDVLEGNILNHTLVPNENLKGQFKKTFRKNDILYSEIRPANKRFAFVDIDDTSKYIASTKLMVLRPRTEFIEPLFLYYLLSSPDLLSEMQHLAETRSGTFPQITFNSELSPYEIWLPDIKIQKQIIAVLSNINGKIELNTRINENLEQQAQAIFKLWFLDNPNLNQLEFVALSELCSTITKGTTPTTLGKSFVNKGINFIKAESIHSNHSIDKNKFSYIDDETNLMLKRSVIQAGDIVFTIAGTLGRFAIIDENILPANTNQAVAIIRADINKVTPEYIYSFFIGNWHNDYYNKRIQQAVQANLSLTTIKSLPIPVLPKVKMKEYCDLIVPIFSKIKSNEIESQILSDTRDTLLPKLMNGEIDVLDVKI